MESHSISVWTILKPCSPTHSNACPSGFYISVLLIDLITAAASRKPERKMVHCKLSY